MANIDVLSWKREKVGSIALPADIFEVPVKKGLLFDVVKWQLDSRRQGTHMTKTKGLVSGGGKKPFKQKGTGNARQGSTRSILMPGGGTAFGPQPRSYAFNLPKKVRKKGLSMALSYLFSEGRFFVVDDMKSEGKTNELNKRLKGFGLNKAVLIDSEVDHNFKRAAGNLEFFKYFPVAGANVFDLLKYDSVVVSKRAIDALVARCQLGES